MCVCGRVASVCVCGSVLLRSSICIFNFWCLANCTTLNKFFIYMAFNSHSIYAIISIFPLAIKVQHLQIARCVVSASLHPSITFSSFAPSVSHRSFTFAFCWPFLLSWLPAASTAHPFHCPSVHPSFPAFVRLRNPNERSVPPLPLPLPASVPLLLCLCHCLA